MLNIVFATAAFAVGSAVAQSVGTAHVVNKCTYPVTLCNVPAAGGGFDEIDKTLQPNGEYSQQWTQLSNGQGWSIKLSKTESLSSIMQYEYTFHNDGTIWYDLSGVNGNPWDGNWMLTATNANCNPKQQAYRYSTDDAYGMQACPQAADITVTLCSGESQDDAGAASASASAEAKTESGYSAPAATSSALAEPSSTPVETSTSSTWEAPTSAPTPEPAPTSTDGGYWPSWGGNTWGGAADKNVQVSASPSPTTFAKVVTSSDSNGYDVTVTDIQTAVVTQIVTATAPAAKRHAHHPRHPHHA